LWLVDSEDVAVMIRFWEGIMYDSGTALRSDRTSSAGNHRANDHFAWIHRLWRRVLVLRGGTRIVANLHILGRNLPEFLASTPDAKIIYMVRDPVESIPSTLSLTDSVMEKSLTFSQFPVDARRQHFLNLYRLLVDEYRGFVDYWTSSAVDRERIMVLPYDRIMTDFAGAIQDVLQFVNHAPGEAMIRDIKNIAIKQRLYISGHSYDPARFYLDAAQIRKDCQFVYDALLPHLVTPTG
jgi:omega-hydroxy-beta-dihydromenaquinone-9 sulfotransferase